MKEKRNSFSKNERLTGKIATEALFGSGKSFFIYPFLIIYTETDGESVSPARILITASKKKFKRAVKRNVIKRRIKESYRLRKNTFYQQLGKHTINLAIVYVGNEILDFRSVDKRMEKALISVIEKLDA